MRKEVGGYLPRRLLPMMNHQSLSQSVTDVGIELLEQLNIPFRFYGKHHAAERLVLEFGSSTTENILSFVFGWWGQNYVIYLAVHLQDISIGNIIIHSLTESVSDTSFD